jgi:hypothetical protein
VSGWRHTKTRSRYRINNYLNLLNPILESSVSVMFESSNTKHLLRVLSLRHRHCRHNRHTGYCFQSVEYSVAVSSFPTFLSSSALPSPSNLCHGEEFLDLVTKGLARFLLVDIGQQHVSWITEWFESLGEHIILGE